MAYLNADQRGGTGDNGKPSLTIDEAASQLTRAQASWGDDWGQAAEVTFAFRSTAPSDMPDDTAGFSRFNATQISATLLALQAWSDVANITFDRIGTGTGGSSAYSNSATILFGNYSSGAEGAAAFAYYPYSYAYGSSDGDVWVNSSLSYNANPQVFNYGQLVLVHEIGHALGLSHPGDYDAGEGVDITYANSAQYFEDSMQYTVMSYFYESYTGASYGSPYPATVMLDDIAAAQRLYGANMSTRAGDTVYGFNSNTDRVWFSASSSSTPLIFAAWDAGGTDTFDFSGYSSNARIELREGFFSDVGGLIGNVAIAKGAVIENALGGNGADHITGNAAANRLQGNAGNDTLTGLGGADVFVFTTGGGSDVVTDFVIGADKLDVSAFGDYVSIVQSGADAVVNFSSTVSVRLTNVTASNLTDASFIGLASQPPSTAGITVKGTDAANLLTGGSGDDILYGYAGADQLNGKAGADTLVGGRDNDVYFVDDAGDLVTEFTGEGVDLVQSTVTYALADQIENLTLTGASAINGSGNTLNNTLLGNGAANTLSGLAGDDRLDGRGGADTLKGGSGNDIYTVHGASELIVELAAEGSDTVLAGASYVLPTNVEILRLTGSAANATGNTSNNQLYGTAGANTLDGRAGADYMSGGAGNDTYIADNSADQPMESAGGGVDSVLSSASFVLGLEVENLTLTGASAINGDGNTLNNTLLGNGAANTLSGLAGDDRLDGRGGADTLKGGAGNDIYTVHGASELVVEAAAEGSDTVLADASYVLPANVEILRLTGSAANATGNTSNNQLYGTAGANTLDGRAGADYMSGGAGNDTYIADNSADQPMESAGGGVDSVLSSASFVLGLEVENLTLTGASAINGDGNTLNNTLLGNGAANTLSGLDGDDILIGGSGKDTLIGGFGADTFVFTALTDSTAATPDLVSDLDPLADRIDLSDIDANVTVGGDQSFAFVGLFDHHAGQAVLGYDPGADITTLTLDVNGDAAADFKLLINGHVLAGSDFIL